MRRARDLYERLADFAHLVRAFRGAARRRTRELAEFRHELEPRLWAMRRALLSGEPYPWGAYRQFRVRDPKPRLIRAAPFADRVLHHAIVDLLDPIIRQSFIADTYACLPDRGVHRAVARFVAFARERRGEDYLLQCDIASYFASVDHEVLYAALARRIADRRLLALLRGLIAHGAEQAGDAAAGGGAAAAAGGGAVLGGGAAATAGGDAAAEGPEVVAAAADAAAGCGEPPRRAVGMPIGNLTSQMFANLYLDPLDHFVRERLRVRHYLRYMDDFVLLVGGREEAWERHTAIEAFLRDRLWLALNARRTVVAPLARPHDVLGYVHRSGGRLRVRRRSVRRLWRRLAVLDRDHRDGRVDWSAVRASIASWTGLARHADARALSRAIFVRRDVRNVGKRLLVSGGGSNAGSRRLGANIA